MKLLQAPKRIHYFSPILRADITSQGNSHKNWKKTWSIWNLSKPPDENTLKTRLATNIAKKEVSFYLLHLNCEKEERQSKHNTTNSNTKELQYFPPNFVAKETSPQTNPLKPNQNIIKLKSFHTPHENTHKTSKKTTKLSSYSISHKHSQTKLSFYLYYLTSEMQKRQSNP